MDGLLHFDQYIGEVHAGRGVVGEHVGESRFTGRGEIPVDVAEMDDASRDEIDGGVLEVLVEVVVVAVADDGVGD